MHADSPDSPDAGARLLKHGELEAMHRALQSLTPRQRQVVMLMGDGARPAEVARALGVSKTTISFHLGRLMRKLGLRSKRDLVKYAVLLKKSAEDSEPHSSGELT